MVQFQQLIIKLLNAIPIITPIFIIVGVFIYVITIQCAGPGANLYNYFSKAVLPSVDAPFLIG